MESRFLAYPPPLAPPPSPHTPPPGRRLPPCQYRAGHTDKVPALVQKLQDWCKQHHWQPPAFRYDPNSRELLWQDDNAEWQPLSKHPLYKAEVNGK